MSYRSVRAELSESGFHFVTVVHYGDDWFEFWMSSHSGGVAAIAVVWPDGHYCAFQPPKRESD